MGSPAASAWIWRAPAATCRRTWASIARWLLRTSSGSSSEYQGTAWPASSIVTRPPPWSRTSPMKVPPCLYSAIAVLCASPEVNGSADAPVPVAYWVASTRKP